MITAEEFIREKIREKQDIRGEMTGLWKYQVNGQDCLRWAHEYYLLQQQSARPVLDWFSKQMEAKLVLNDHKGGWKDCEIDWLIKRLQQETNELIERWNARQSSMQGRSAGENVPLIDVDNEAIINECADVANFAMMIADKFGEEYCK